MHITIEKKKHKRFTKPAYTITEAAELLGVHVNTLYRLCRSGKLGAFRIGNAWRIPGDNLEALIVPENRTGPKPKKKGGAE